MAAKGQKGSSTCAKMEEDRAQRAGLKDPRMVEEEEGLL
jgi:hypothetical protein